MRLLLLAVLFFCGSHTVKAQLIYVNVEEDLYRLDIAACEYEFVSRMDHIMTDLTFHPNGTFYAINSDGELFIVDIDDGQSWQIHNWPGYSFTSLTSAADGIIYAASADGELHSYNPVTDQGRYHGNFGAPATGDLTFHDGELYVAASLNRIIRLDINNPSNSTVAINDFIFGEIWGIVSFAEDCNDVRTYAISNGNSVIYQIDFDNQSLNAVCQLDIEVWGGASSYEFLASAPITVNTSFTNLPTCDDFNGEVTVIASGGIGQLMYALNGGPFQTGNVFQNLQQGYHLITVMDEGGCEVTHDFNVPGQPVPVIDSVVVLPATCGIFNGELSVAASGGAGMYNYSIDQINFQASAVFTGLPAGNYLVTVQDVNGCSATSQVEVPTDSPAFIESVVVDFDPCMPNSGSASVVVEGTGIMFSINGSAFQAAPTFQNLPSGTFHVTTRDENGCTDTVYFDIPFSNPPVIEEVMILGLDCNESTGTIDISVIGGNGNVSIAIDHVSHADSTHIGNISPGVHMIHVADESGCEDHYEFSIPVLEKFKIESAEMNASDCGVANGGIKFTVSPANGAVVGNIDGGTFQSVLDFTHLGAGFYEFTFMDDAGCTIDTVLQITAGDCDIYIPNTFSPNDDGVNDFFKLSSQSDGSLIVKKYFLFDRWGNMVYKAFDFGMESDLYWWDGSFRKISMGQGVYAYYIEIQDPDGHINTFKGNVTLVR